MPFYQNVFDQEFRGHWILGGERQLATTWPVPANRNRPDYMEAWNIAPYDFSTYNTLTINFAYDPALKNYSSLAINVVGAVPSTTTADEVVAALNANTSFTDLFTAQTRNARGGVTVLIKGTKGKGTFRAYISNPGAEQIMRFNKWAGVAELPSYFDRHTIDNRFNYDDGQAMLIKLDQTDSVVGQPIITDAGFVPGNMQADWQLLHGRTTTFIFQKNTVDGSNRITQTIEYPAGAKAGDLAKLKKWTYSGSNTSPTTYTEQPYVLQTADLITNP